MLNVKTKIVFVFLIVTGLFLRNTGFTDADLFAQRQVFNNVFSFSTISFSSQNTANNTRQSRIFDVTGIIPQGFAVSSFRLRKDGQLNFKYHIKTNFIGGYQPFCDALSVKLMQDTTFKYRGLLKDIDYSSMLSDNQYHDWVMWLELQSDNADYKNKSCQFEVVVRSWRQNVDEKTGIFAQQQLLASVTSGNW